MGETLKERLDRLSEAEIKAERVANYRKTEASYLSWLSAYGHFIRALMASYRSGDLIPRDEITPAMAAEVLLQGQGRREMDCEGKTGNSGGQRR